MGTVDRSSDDDSDERSEVENQPMKLSPKLQAASEYLDSLSRIPESMEALREADEIRKSWIRKFD